MFAVYPHNHHVHANAEGYDLGFIEAEHYDREASCQPESLAQVPLNGVPSIEHYASTDVPVLAYPVLFCLAHTFEHSCAHTHKVAPDMGVCDLSLIKDTDSYEPSLRESITAERTYTGRIVRK